LEGAKMKLICIEDVYEGIFNKTKVLTKGRIYSGNFSIDSSDTIYFITYDDNKEWEQYSTDYFKPVEN
jgi:hypothetical protein